jgi:hypothetical protein
MLKAMWWDNDNTITHDSPHTFTTVTLGHIVTMTLDTTVGFVIPLIALMISTTLASACTHAETRE